MAFPKSSINLYPGPVNELESLVKCIDLGRFPMNIRMRVHPAQGYGSGAPWSTSEHLVIIVRTQDSGCSVAKEVDINFYEPIPLGGFDGEKQALSWIRDRLQKVLTHELDEFLRVNGELVTDPHQGEIR